MAKANATASRAKIDKERFLALVESGHTSGQLLKEFGVSRPAIRWRAVALGVHEKVLQNSASYRALKNEQRRQPRKPRQPATPATTAYRMQKCNALQRGIEWQLSFEEWWAIWDASGHWEDRGCRKGNYVMSRPGDKGPYAIGNVSIATIPENNREARSHAERRNGVYCARPGSKKPWSAKFAKKYLGYFATEAEARAKREAAVAAYAALHPESRRIRANAP